MLVVLDYLPEGNRMRRAMNDMKDKQWLQRVDEVEDALAWNYGLTRRLSRLPSGGLSASQRFS